MAELNYDNRREPQSLVLLHGFPFNRSMWEEQIDSFAARGFQVVAPDLRGLGENRFHGDVATMADMAREVAGVMDESAIKHAIVCGLSLGCYVAFEFIQLFPSRVDALVLCGPRAQGPDAAEKRSREEQARRALVEGMDFALESISSKLLAQQTLTERPQVVERVCEMVLSTDPRGAAAVQRGMAARRDYSNDLDRIDMPTLIVAGREDGVRTPADSEFIYRRISGSKLVVIDDAGHLMNMEQPEVFNEILVDFAKTIKHQVSEARR
jgi:pimeloyl-ACP methyl ester carboxylesterase